MADIDASPDGIAQWWPKAPNDKTNSSEWRLDVITLLAVIGESSMAEHSQTITASSLCLLPRILPAPQALLKPSRPNRMPQRPAKLTGVHSGVVLDTVGFFANIIHPLDKFEPFEFKVLDIEHADIVPSKTPPLVGTVEASRFGNLPEMLRRVLSPKREKKDSDINEGSETLTIGGKTEQAAATSSMDGQRHVARWAGNGTVDPEQGIHRRPTKKDIITDFVLDPVLVNRAERPAVPAALFSPLHILSVFSMLLTVALLVGARSWTDGPATAAVALISLQSSLVGYASWWKPVLMLRTHKHKVPRGDVMIRTREGAFLLIRCTEDVARELYTGGTEECQYRVGERSYRSMMGLGTVMLMISTVLLGNCSWYMQLFVGASYICLNGMYWAAGMLPRALFWDLSRYRWVDRTPPELRDAHLSSLRQHQKGGHFGGGGGSNNDNDGDDEGQYEQVASFTRTLWYAIRATKVTGWVMRSGAAPMTEEWKQWLREAEAAAQDAGKAATWRAVYRKKQIIAHDDGSDREARGPGMSVGDPGKQHAPLTEIQGPGLGSNAVPATDHF